MLREVVRKRQIASVNRHVLSTITHTQLPIHGSFIKEIFRTGYLYISKSVNRKFIEIYFIYFDVDIIGMFIEKKYKDYLHIPGQSRYGGQVTCQHPDKVRESRKEIN